MENSNSRFSPKEISILNKYNWPTRSIIAAEKSDFKCAICGFDFLDSPRSIYSWNLLTIEEEDIPFCNVCKNLLGRHKPEKAARTELIDELRKYIEPKYQNKLYEVLEQRKIIRKS
ncbi:MAG: hypothetical protein Q4F84_01290 [Fibrobacter sp.]|nr:hypothetical protein [Fibrobacter sp.]